MIGTIFNKLRNFDAHTGQVLENVSAHNFTRSSIIWPFAGSLAAAAVGGAPGVFVTR